MEEDEQAEEKVEAALERQEEKKEVDDAVEEAKEEEVEEGEEVEEAVEAVEEEEEDQDFVRVAMVVDEVAILEPIQGGTMAEEMVEVGKEVKADYTGVELVLFPVDGADKKEDLVEE